VGVAVGVAVSVAVGLAVGDKVKVGLAVGAGVAVSIGVRLGSSVGLGVFVSELVAVGTGVAVGWLSALQALRRMTMTGITARRLLTLQIMANTEVFTRFWRLSDHNGCTNGEVC